MRLIPSAAPAVPIAMTAIVVLGVVSASLMSRQSPPAHSPADPAATPRAESIPYVTDSHGCVHTLIERRNGLTLVRMRNADGTPICRPITNRQPVAAALS